MDISKINASVLRSLIKLIEQRDELVAELQKVEAALTAAYSGAASAPVSVSGERRGRKPGRKPQAAKPVKEVKPVKEAQPAPAAAKAGRKSGRRGALKTKILAALKAGGDKGLSVQELSKKLGVKNQNIHVWFSSTGKKTPGLQKIGPGRYRLKP